MKALKKHPLQTIDECTGGPSAHVGCSKHSEPFKIFCATCMVPLCSTCAVIDHKGGSHDLRQLSTMATRFVEKLAEKAAPVEQQQAKLAEAVVKVKAVKASIATNKKAAHAVVDATEKAIRQAATRYAARSNAAVNEAAAAKNAVLDDQLVILIDAQEQVAGGLEYYEYSVDPSRPPVHLLEATAVLMPGLQLLAGLDHSVVPRVSDSLIHAGNPTGVVNSIDTLGTVVCHDAVAANCVVAGAGLDKAWVGKEVEFTVELRDGESAVLQDLPVEAALAMVAVTVVARVAAVDGGGGVAGRGGRGGGGSGGYATVSVPVPTTCTVGGALLSYRYTVQLPALGVDADVPDMAVEIVVQVLGRSVPQSPFAVVASDTRAETSPPYWLFCAARRNYPVKSANGTCETCSGRYQRCNGSYGYRDTHGSGRWRSNDIADMSGMSVDIANMPESPNCRWCCKPCQSASVA
jgi:hypothetical protein